MMQNPSVFMLGHGSRDATAIREFEQFVDHFRQRMQGWQIGYGFLEFARPTIREGLAKMVADGATAIECLPGMLFAASHVKNDLPAVLHEFSHRNPQLRLRMGRELAIDGKLLRAAADRIEQAIDQADAASPHPIDRKDTVLMVIGRGTSDPDANGNVAKISRMLSEGLGFGWSEYGYSGTATPRTAAALAHAVKLGYRRILVFPYFLFGGILVDRIRAETDEIRRLNPAIEIIDVPYLGPHPLVIEAFIDRLREIDRGENLMNCQLCKYRTRILGYDAEVGAPQQTHHHD
ncbi:MAG: sirohydrochlorin chelatase, partial [Alphaproteobacteria bacterium]|nr:sirohydrochlorin chelatase [Alphaproteobacteria bacterium]